MKHLCTLFACVAFICSTGFGQDNSNARDEANMPAGGTTPLVQPTGDGSQSHILSPLALLYDNGPLVTHPGGGLGGADASSLQNTVLNTYGYNVNAGASFRVADDFTVSGGAWIVDSIAFFGYQTGSTTTSTMTAVRLQIWDGPPGEAGSNIIFGDITTNRMIATRFSGIYRVIATNLLASDRPIMRNIVDVGGLLLLPGTYWLDWTMTGSLASGPWQPAVTILGQFETGNARQFTGTIWQAMRDSVAPATGNPQGAPFTMYGTASSNPLNPFALQTPAAGVTITTLPGSTTPVTVTWDTSTATATYKWIFGAPIVPPRIVTLPSSTNSINTTLGEVDAILAGLGVQQGDSVTGQWDVWAFRNNPPANDSLKSSNGPRAITFKRGRPVLSAFGLVSPANDATVVTSAASTAPITVVWRKSGDGASYRWKFATPTFAGTIRLNIPAGLDTSATFRSSQLDSLIAGLGVAQGDSITGQWRVYAYSGTDSLASSQTFDITFKRAVPPTILIANPGPANNGGSPGWGMFFNLIGGAQTVTITNMTTANAGTAGAAFSIEFFTRTGNALGGPVGSGPGSSTDGWTSVGTVPVTQGPVASGVSLLFSTPPIVVTPGDTVGVAMRFNTIGPRYFGTGTPPYETYFDANLRLVTGDVRSAPFTTTGSFFTSRALVGEIHYAFGSTDVRETGQGVPVTYVLSQNYPNPFNPSTTIKFAIPLKEHVTLKIYNTIGQLVATLQDGELNAGSFEATWNASNMASGVYFYRLQAGNFSQAKKLVLLK
ncbi:MAG: T9SS type A sorting domain-containing protein [Bacteroidetes bacterium]|nr:T9SS type A sorting domain-containing protein [Bacteroidota bacterium]MCW5895453.1 T9SS type A sorting domain-containing protein [Bacteroidota bacterium]